MTDRNWHWLVHIIAGAGLMLAGLRLATGTGPGDALCSCDAALEAAP